MVPSPQENTVKDENYDLVSVLETSLRNAWQMDVYIRDAELAEDRELAEWFRSIQRHNLEAGEQGKRLLHDRLSRDGAEQT